MVLEGQLSLTSPANGVACEFVLHSRVYTDRCRRIRGHEQAGYGTEREAMAVLGAGPRATGSPGTATCIIARQPSIPDADASSAATTTAPAMGPEMAMVRPVPSTYPKAIIATLFASRSSNSTTLVGMQAGPADMAQPCCPYLSVCPPARTESSTAGTESICPGVRERGTRSRGRN